MCKNITANEAARDTSTFMMPLLCTNSLWRRSPLRVNMRMVLLKVPQATHAPLVEAATAVGLHDAQHGSEGM